MPHIGYIYLLLLNNNCGQKYSNSAIIFLIHQRKISILNNILNQLDLYQYSTLSFARLEIRKI